MENPDEFAKNYSSQMATQMRKGLLGYFILLIAREPVYASDITPTTRCRRSTRSRGDHLSATFAFAPGWATGAPMAESPVDRRANITI